MNRLAKGVCGFFVVIILSVFSVPLEAIAVEIGHPQLTVENYEIVKGKFEKGAECTFRVTVKNVDDENIATAGMITLFSERVSPVTGKANQIIFGELEPEQSVTVDFDVNLDMIEKGPNVIEFVLAWYDEDYVNFTNSIHIAPVLLEQVGFELTAVNIPNTVYGNKNTIMSVYYENTGDENLRDVYMVVEGDIVQEKQVVELDNLEAKGKEMVDYSLELLNVGNNKVSVSFRYEDRNGNQYTSEKTEMVVNVTDKTYIEPVVEENTFKSIMTNYRIYVIFGIVAVLLFVPFVISAIRRGGKKK